MWWAYVCAAAALVILGTGLVLSVFGPDEPRRGDRVKGGER